MEKFQMTYEKMKQNYLPIGSQQLVDDILYRFNIVVFLIEKKIPVGDEKWTIFPLTGFKDFYEWILSINIMDNVTRYSVWTDYVDKASRGPQLRPK